MKEKTFKKAVYIVLFILIVIFFTKDCDFFFGFYKNIRQITNPDDIYGIQERDFFDFYKIVSGLEKGKTL